jgi:hypothetical protein
MMRAMALVSAAVLILGIPMGLVLIGLSDPLIQKVGWCLILNGLAGIYAMYDILVLEPRNRNKI